MKTIKKYWAIFVTLILGVGLAIFAIFNKQSKNKAAKIDQKIDDNDSKIDQLQGKIDVIEEQRDKLKKDIKQKEQTIEETKLAKDNIVVEKPKTVKTAKDNILNKTNKKRKIKS